MAKQVELSVRCVVKGYHECPFYVNIGQNSIQWCDPKMLIEKYPAGGSDTERFIDPSKLKLMLPRLEKLEEERLQKQRRAKEQEREEAKKGAPENLSKELLKEILAEHGITFKKSANKTELINKVLDLRRQLQQRANVTANAIENDGPETVDEIAVAHLDEPTSDFAFTSMFNQVFQLNRPRRSRNLLTIKMHVRRSQD